MNDGPEAPPIGPILAIADRVQTGSPPIDFFLDPLPYDGLTPPLFRIPGP